MLSYTAIILFVVFVIGFLTMIRRILGFKDTTNCTCNDMFFDPCCPEHGHR